MTAIPPLPLWLLLEADKDTQNQQTKKTENKEDVSNILLVDKKNGL